MLSPEWLIDSYRTAKLLELARELSLHRLLQEPCSARRLSAAWHRTPTQAEALLRAFASIGLVTRRRAQWHVHPSLAKVGFSSLVSACNEIDAKLSTALRFANQFRDIPSDAYEALARGIGEECPLARREIAQAILKTPTLGPALRAARTYLEVGVGRGILMCSLAEALPHLRAVGIDCMPRSRRLVRELALTAGVSDRVKCQIRNAALGLPRGSWEIVYWSQAFFASDERVSVLNAIRQSLSRDGLLLMSPYAHLAQCLPPRLRREYAFEHAAFAFWNRELRSEVELMSEAEKCGFVLRRKLRLWKAERFLVFSPRPNRNRRADPP